MAYKGRLKTFQTAFAKPQPAAFVQAGIWFDANPNDIDDVLCGVCLINLNWYQHCRRRKGQISGYFRDTSF